MWVAYAFGYREHAALRACHCVWSYAFGYRGFALMSAYVATVPPLACRGLAFERTPSATAVFPPLSSTRLPRAFLLAYAFGYRGFAPPNVR
jgi:hypothetical protein